MKGYRQVILGFVAALLSLTVILGSLSLSLSETGLKLALQSSPTRTRSTRALIMTQTVIPATLLPGEITNLSQFTPSIAVTNTPLFPFVALPSPTSSCPPPPGWYSILIQEGDTLDSIALIYNVSKNELMQVNCLYVPELMSGTYLYVPGALPPTPTAQCGKPPGWISYKVKKDDTLFHIGITFGVSVADLQFANCRFSTIIREGEILFVPNRPTQTPEVAPTRPKPTVLYPSSTPTPVPTQTPTIPASLTPIPTNTNTPVLPTRTSTSLPTNTNTPVLPPASPTDTPTSTSTQTETPSPTGTLTPTPSSTSTDTPVPTATPTVTPTDTPAPSAPSVP